MPSDPLESSQIDKIILASALTCIVAEPSLYWVTGN